MKSEAVHRRAGRVEQVTGVGLTLELREGRGTGVGGGSATGCTRPVHSSCCCFFVRAWSLSQSGLS